MYKADDVSIKGKLVRLEQPYQACPKLVAFCVWFPTAANEVKLLQLRKAS